MDFSFNTYLKTAPPTIVLHPDIPRFTIIDANAAYLEATNTKLEELIGKEYLHAFTVNSSPSITKNIQSLENSITEAVLTKRQHVLPSQRYDIPVGGTDQFNTRYWRTTSSPIVNENGDVECIVLETLDMTSDVATVLKERFTFEVAEEKRKAIQQIEERLRLAIDSADMGTWYMDVVTQEFTPSQRMKTLFGYNPEEKMSFEAAVLQILPEYRESVSRAVDSAFKDNVPFNIEYPVEDYHDRKIRWVKATGKCYEAHAGGTAHFSGTIMDITEKKMEELRKNDFLSIASHELKTPLTSLNGCLQLLTKMKNNPSAVMLPKLIDQSNRSMDKINSLVNELLNVSRITEGKFELNQSVFNVANMIGGCCDHVTSAGTHELVIEGDLDLKVLADEQRIDQVLINLVNNAVKYASGSYKIILRIEPAYPMAKISVQDFGPGISKNHLDQLFERYYRADTTNIQNSGLGLGLFISAEIIKKHGGQIGVESEIGKGSTFWFTIPLAEA